MIISNSTFFEVGQSFKIDFMANNTEKSYEFEFISYFKSFHGYGIKMDIVNKRN